MSKKKKAGRALLEVDRKAHQAVLPFQDTPPVKALAWLSELGDQPQMLTLSGSVLAWGAVRRDPRLMRAGGRMIASHLLATWIKNVIKHRVDRTRPFAAQGQEDRKPKAGRDTSKEETSFPSGHSAGAMAVAQAFARELPEHRGKALAGAGLIAAAQVPRCAHYPTDVGAGLAIGWASEQLVDAAFRWARGPADASPIPPV
jgi:membrane-associated phospholipid phosphatase